MNLPEPDTERKAAALVRAGMQLHEAGDVDGAEALYRQALAASPNNIEALYLQAQAARDRQQPQRAVELLQRAVTLQPQAAVLHSALGDARMECGAPDAALRDYRAALDRQPDLVEARAGVAAALQQTGELAAAVEAYRRALEQVPQCAELHYNAAVALDDLNRLDEALYHCRQAVDAKPDYGPAWIRLGGLLKRAERGAEALKAFQTASGLADVAADGYVNLGALLREGGHRDTALKCLQRAVELAPESPGALCNLGMCYRELGQLDAAIDYMLQAYGRNPEDGTVVANLFNALQDACRWDELARIGPQVERLIDRALTQGSVLPVSPFMALSMPLSPARQQAIARHFAEHEVKPGMTRAPLPHRTATKRERIRIGYVSGNFRNHPTSHLMVRLFELHDHERFEIFVYSHGKDDGSEYRRRIEQASDHFIDVCAESTAETAERIARDGIDILVDRAGYTNKARPEIFALRPAPVQVNYIGFPGTLGADYMDYIITDSMVTPPGGERWFAEQPVYLPDSYLVTDPAQAVAAEYPSREACGLPPRGFVFCSFNNNFKIEPSMFAVWMRILRAVPDSVLWLLRSSDTAEASLRAAAQSHGVDAARLVFADRAPKPQHLARHVHADLFLDTRYYNAHTTAVDALYMGLPVLTCPGECFAARVGASVVAAAGAGELIVPDLAAYERLAVELASAPERLAAARGRLEQVRASALFDTAAYARHLERGFADMWARQLAGLPPAPIRVKRH